MTGVQTCALPISFFDSDELVKEITKNGKTLKIGVFGVSDPEMKNKTTPSNVEGLDFQDAVAYAKRGFTHFM